MVDTNTSESLGPGSFKDFIEGNPNLTSLDMTDQVLAYSRDVLQPYKVQKMAERAGGTAVSPLIESMGRNDG